MHASALWLVLERWGKPERRRWRPGLVLMGLSLFLMLGLSACRSDRVTVNPKDPGTPQFAYRLDELELLKMTADDIQELERKKQYGQIYDAYASDAFKTGVSRRRFLIMSNCVESNLGPLLEYDSNDVGFRREKISGAAVPLDVLNRAVARARASLEEQLVFSPYRLKFRLNGLYWISKDKAFLDCVRQSPQVEAATAPKAPEAPALPPGVPTETVKPTGAGENAVTSPVGPESGKAAPATGPNPEKPAAEKPSSPEPVTPAPVESKPASGVSSPSSGGLQPPVPAPVLDMKPSEIRKQPLQARPAGAGAVEDLRPVARPKLKPKPLTPVVKPAASAGSAPAPEGLKPVQPQPLPATEPKPNAELKPVSPANEPPTP